MAASIFRIFSCVCPLIVRAQLDLGDECQGSSQSVHFLQTSHSRRLPLSKAHSHQHPPWANKNGDLKRTGYSPGLLKSVDLTNPSWEIKLPSLSHATPLIDEHNRVYMSGDGFVMALHSNGSVMWSSSIPEVNSGGIPALLDNTLYSCTTDGHAFALNASTGVFLWKRKLGASCSADAWSAVTDGRILIQPVNLEDTHWTRGGGVCDIAALDPSDGSTKWTFRLCKTHNTSGYNLLPPLLDNSLVFQDKGGGAHCLSLADGQELWSTPAYDTFTTAGIVVAPNNVSYGAFNYKGYADSGIGRVEARNATNGNLVWGRSFDDLRRGINCAPAVGALSKDGPLVVVLGIADNFLPFLGVPPKIRMTQQGTVLVLDANTGNEVWSYDVENYTGMNYPLMKEMGCLPDAFSNPSIGGDGTVYINWSGGISYAIRDVDGDGKIDEARGEVVKLYTESGMNGQTALGTGVVAVPSCDKIRGYVIDL